MNKNLKKTLSVVLMTATLCISSLATTAFAAPKQEVCCTHVQLDNAADGHWCGYYRETRYGEWEDCGWTCYNPFISHRYRARRVSVCCQTCGKELSYNYQCQGRDYTLLTLIPISDWYNI